MSTPRSFALRTGGGSAGLGNEAPSPAALARAQELRLERQVRAAYEAACLALFAERLPYELQMHVLSFIPIRHLVKSIARADRFYADMVDRYVRGCVWREMRCEEEGTGNRLIFEAQRPIDTLTTKHILYFSHFGPEEAAAGSHLGGGITTLAHFNFLPPRSTARSSSRGGRSRSTSKAREQAGSVPSGRYAPHGATYLEAEQRSDVPYNLPASLQSRLNNARLSSSIAPVPQTFETPERAEEGPARVLPRTGETQEVRPLPPQAHAQAQTQTRRTTATGQHNDLRDFTDVSAPNLWREGSRSAARLVHDEEPDVPALDAQATEREHESEEEDEDAAHAEEEATTWDSLGSALDAYDWAGPISSSHPSSRSRRAARQHCASAHSPTYRFQLDALDSFESWCLSLTLQRRERAPQGVPRDATRQVRYGTQWPAPMRWEKRVAEGLDRVFREFFVPPPATALPAVHAAAASSSSSSARVSTKTQPPPERVLEFDGPSCVLSIQPHAHAHASSAHPATSSSSHAYLSFPSLADQYSAGQARRVELTFHVPAVRIGAARLAAALEDVASDVQRAKEAPRAMGWSTWGAGTGGNWRAL